MIRNANDLTAAEKAALETLLGRRVENSEAVSVRAFEQARLSPQQRLEISNQLNRYFAEVDAERKRVTDSEQEDTITEAMRSLRPEYRSH